MVISLDADLFAFGLLLNLIIVGSLGLSLWHMRHLWGVLEPLPRALIVICVGTVFYFVIMGVINADSTLNALQGKSTATATWLRHLARIPDILLTLASIQVYRLTRKK